ncbi:coiled-coil domain-containing protein 42 homolog [Paramisgurnus dabryanus]|uniref:coiled-coil domain-containing protein 42 homolog n=1 Tax=Paramisgurnus dabryanus TaxID=90735 RepID=UPI0031F44063
MNLNLDDYFRTVYEKRLSNEAVHERDLTTEASRLLVKRQEVRRVDRELKTQKEEVDKKREGFRQRKENMMKEEEKLKEFVMNYNAFVKENDAKRTHALKKAEAERAQIMLKEHKLEKLQIKLDALLAQKALLESRVNKASIYKHFLDSAVKMSRKFENIGQLIARCQTVQSLHEHLMEKHTATEKERKHIGLELRQYKNEHSFVLLDYSNRLSQQQTQLDNIRAQAYKWEAVMKHIQANATKETLLWGQIKVTILNLYYMIGKVPVDVEDTLFQLEKIQNFLQVHSGRKPISEITLPHILKPHDRTKV